MAPKPTQKETENDKEKEKDSDAEAEESESDVPDGECAECGQVFNTPDEDKCVCVRVWVGGGLLQCFFGHVVKFTHRGITSLPLHFAGQSSWPSSTHGCCHQRDR